MGSSWVQFADYKLPLGDRSCENYKVPHNRRGVLSMCNDGRHKHNTTQFFVCLNPTPWMDYRYVAFGQLIQGDDVLKMLENCSTYYESPKDNLEIVNSGEITLNDAISIKMVKLVEKYIDSKEVHPDVIDPRESPSEMLDFKYNLGMYHFLEDNKSYLNSAATITSLSSVEGESVYDVNDYRYLFDTTKEVASTQLYCFLPQTYNADDGEQEQYVEKYVPKTQLSSKDARISFQLAIPEYLIQESVEE